MKGKFLFAAIIVLCTSISIVYAALQVQKTINAFGNVKNLNVQVYQDSTYTVVLTQIDWGIAVVVYGKTTSRPYNTQVERCFGNIAETIYQDIKYVQELDNEQFT